MYEYSCTVERIVDGDTIDVTLDLGFSVSYSSRVRLYGIDTPESRTRNKDEKARGKLASAFLSKAIEIADQVVIRTELKDSRGKFGRVLGTVVCDGEDINQGMVEGGFAVKYYGQSKKDVEAEHLINRQKLIDQGIFDPDSI
jgi:micrococcal nuclease|tara:strand:+ start:439 stop:864 length:426 start_codon:yes stop_codon:yes gene_type:complete